MSGIKLALIVTGLYISSAALCVATHRGERGGELLSPRSTAEGPVSPGPSRDNFGLLRKGMRLAEVEAILGPAGGNYSSISDHDYYIWKGKDGWSRVWISQGRVSQLKFDGSLSVND
jgi:hypothetical protein